MEQPLDLSVLLTAPPQGAPDDVLASVTMQCDGLGMGWAGGPLLDPVARQERDELRWYLSEYWKWPYLGFAERGKRIESLLPRVGQRLYEAVFRQAEAGDIVRAWQDAPVERRQLSIISSLPRVLALPWELLHDGDGFLAVRAPVALVRRLHLHEHAPEPRTFAPPLRILFIAARPRGAGFVDPRLLAHELLDEVQESINTGMIELEFLRPSTLAALNARLQQNERPIHALHFDGHGVFNEWDRQGALAFEDDGGALHLVKAEELAKVLRYSGVQLVVLTACQSARGSADDALSTVAAQLLSGGIDAVVAMSATFLATSAAHYTEAFYHAIASSLAISQAQEQARARLHADPRRHPLYRRKNEKGAAVELQDWWVPHFYQQRPLLMQAIHVPGADERLHRIPSGGPLNQEMPARPRYGFIGRARELLRLERWLLSGKLVVISGFGGTGKTVLAREAAEWFTRTGLYSGACFVSFEHGGDASRLLSALGQFLVVYDGFYRPDDAPAALARLRPVLSRQRTLVIADNLESILPGGEAPLDAAARTHLWDVLLELANLGAGVLLTSRDTTFVDRRLVRSRAVAHLPLKGLHPEDAYGLASRLLDTLGIDRSQVPYTPLRELLARLDHLPLAIQLVLPVLRDHPIAKVATDFEKLLPTFVDDRATGRNRSLLASLEYSLRRLSEEQQALLHRLAVFEGGASEDDLLAITEIHTSVWITLRSTLEQAALLATEQVHEDIGIPFLHFHPVLVPYLRSRQKTENTALLQRHARRYYIIATYLYKQDFQHPQAVRALVRRELPNLRRAWDWFLKAGEIEITMEMTECLARFLTAFGLMQERDQLRQRVMETMKIGPSEKGEMTRAEYLHEMGMAQDERDRGQLRAAVKRVTLVLARVEAQPEGSPRGFGSFTHCRVLQELARCLYEGEQLSAAEAKLREALSIINALLEQDPGHRTLESQHASSLRDLGDILCDQRRYVEAKASYEESLKLYSSLEDQHNQAGTLMQLGTLAREQQDYAEARSHYLVVRDLSHELGEPAQEAVAWHNLGLVAQRQEEWAEAERCYRESLALKERLGDLAGAARTCNQLAMIAENTDRPAEAEGWYKHALALTERLESEGLAQAYILNNLAVLLVNAVKAGRVSQARLDEARQYAERSLHIQEQPGISIESWKTFAILAEIAELKGQIEQAEEYRTREREAYATSEGNRYQTDQKHGPLIATIADAARGDASARAQVEELLPILEQRGWHVTSAVRRLWAGERDWQALVNDLDGPDALLVLHILETIAQSKEERTRNRTPTREGDASLEDAGDIV